MFNRVTTFTIYANVWCKKVQFK